MKKHILIFLILISTNTYSQETFSFENKIHPEKTYTLELNLSSIDETTINHKTAKSQSASKITRVITTKKANNNGQFPATMKFRDVVLSGAGKEVSNPFSNTIIIGLLSEDNKFNIDSIINPEMDQQNKIALKSKFEELKPEIDFPKKPLRIGDSFEHKIPNIFFFNGVQIKVLMTKTLTLKSVINNNAEFTVSERISLNTKSNTITASGDGNGIVEFNIIENQLVKVISHFKINIALKNDNINVTGIIQSDSKEITIIN